MFRRSSKKSAKTRKMTPQAMWRHMIREKKTKEIDEGSDNNKKGEQRSREWETALPFMDRLGAYPSCHHPANQSYRSIELGSQNKTHLFLCLDHGPREK